MSVKYPAYQFALFRMIFGFYLLVHFLYLIPVASELWSNAGFISDVTLNPSYGFFPNVLYVLNTELMLTLFVCFMALLSFFVMIGFYRRTASLLLWYGWACLFHQNNLILNPGIPMVGWLLVALVLIPKGEGFAVEKEEVDWYMPPILFWGAWIILGVAYTISGLDKALSPSWQDGSAITHLLNNPLARDYFVRDFLLWLPEVFRQFLTWGTLLLEITFGFFALFSKTRLWAWLMIMTMHLSILLIVDFADLTFGVIMLHLFTFDGRWFNVANKDLVKKERIVIFDGVCGFCNKSIDLLIKLDKDKLFKYTSLQGEYVKKLDIAKDLESIVFYEEGKIYYKSTAVLKILRSLGGVGILANIFFIIPKFIRDFIYDVIAKYRYTIFGKMETCRMPKVEERALFLA